MPIDSFPEYMNEYRNQLEQGIIQKAYRGLMDYFNTLKRYFAKKYPDYSVSGSVYSGYMDMTYFSLVPPLFKDRKLKVAIVFLHEAFRFEVWLVGNNRTIQSQYWTSFTERDWNQYRIATPAKGVDAILDHVLVDPPDFRDLNALTQHIENRTLKFIEDVEHFLSTLTTDSGIVN